MAQINNYSNIDRISKCGRVHISVSVNALVCVSKISVCTSLGCWTLQNMND